MQTQTNHRPPPPGLTVRPAEEADIPAIREIYAHHVNHGTGSFEEVAPEVPEMHRRWQAIVSAGQPFLVAELDGEVLGYAYAGPFRPRSAYRHTVEDSVYIGNGNGGRGIGGALLEELIALCTQKGYRQMVAVIGDSGNSASLSLHSRMGFHAIGTLRATGFKLGRWVDSVLMQRALGEGDSTLPE